MLIGSSRKPNEVDVNNCKVVINGEELERVNNVKFTGVIIDENLKFKMHANYIQNKASKKNMLYRESNVECITIFWKRKADRQEP